MRTDRKDASDPRTHAVPILEGKASRRHTRVATWRLRLAAAAAALRYARMVRDAGSLVLFAGWPRSGHSLVGALIDAHPQAAISHELDAIGLFAKGVPAHHLPGLCLKHASRFTADGRWWNGFRYDIEGGAHGVTAPVKAIGDKKGDWATRWSLIDPDLPKRLAQQSALRPRWILVTRHPADNIATMSLRRGKTYDRLRISAGDRFDPALRAAQAAGDIARQADDEMIADYGRLAQGVAAMKAMANTDWLEISYEELARDPMPHLARIEAFLGLTSNPGWRTAAAASIRPSRRASRDLLGWSDVQIAAVAKIIDTHDFLDPYAA